MQPQTATNPNWSIVRVLIFIDAAGIIWNYIIYVHEKYICKFIVRHISQNKRTTFSHDRRRVRGSERWCDHDGVDMRWIPEDCRFTLNMILNISLLDFTWTIIMGSSEKCFTRAVHTTLIVMFSVQLVSWNMRLESRLEMIHKSQIRGRV